MNWGTTPLGPLWRYFWTQRGVGGKHKASCFEGPSHRLDEINRVSQTNTPELSQSQWRSIMIVIARTVIFVLILAPLPAAAQCLLTRVIDTGAGHASVTVIPGGFYMVYDTGHWNHDDLVSKQILALIPESKAIDLLVLSHSDADHLGATDEIFQHRQVRTVLRTGLCRDTQAWKKADHAIRHAAKTGATTVFNLRRNQIAPGTCFQLGDATVTFLAGDDCPNHYDQDLRGSGDCTGPNRSKARNAGSIVLRLEYAGRSILFTGDAVGRNDGSPACAAPIATEAELLSRQDKFPIDSDVIIAPHHGADNASSTEFIQAVSPTWVIFPAGSAHRHPRQSTAERYLAQRIPPEQILRTDLGDNEGMGNDPTTNADDEWDYSATSNGDSVGDDDIDIIIQANGTLNVKYRDAASVDCGIAEVTVPNPSGGECLDR